MRKSTWMSQLERALSREGMTGMEKRTVLNYYEEMYQDRLDDGAAEEEIIKEFGFPEDVAQSVRENDEKSRRDEEIRKDKERKDGAPKDDVPTGTYVNGGYDVESQGYFRPAPQYAAAAQYSRNGAPAGSAGNAQPKQSGSPMSVARTVVYIIFAIAFFAVGFGLAVGGVAVIASSFVTIAFSAGVWLIVFGVGLVIFACGCLLFGAAIKFCKSVFNSGEGGAK